MANKLNVSHKDPMKKLVEKQNRIVRPRTLGVNAKIQNWKDHAEKKHIIENYTTIIDGKAYVTTPAEGTVMSVQFEDLGDHGEAWIVMTDEKTGDEFQRKNVLNVDLLTWAYDEELPESETK